MQRSGLIVRKQKNENKKNLILLHSISPMDFARPVSFKNADIGRCVHQKLHEDEDGAAPAEIVIQPEPVPTPAFPTPTAVLTHVSVYIIPIAF